MWDIDWSDDHHILWSGAHPADRSELHVRKTRLGWLGVILTLCLAGLWLWLAGQPGVAWSVAVTAFVVVPAALAGAAAARGDRRRAGSVAAAPASAPAVACTGRSGAVLALWDEDGRLVQEHSELATAGARAR